MINQFVFLLFLAILGTSFMFLFRKNISLINIYALSLPMGLFLWGFILLILLIPGIPFNALFIIFLNILLLAAFLLFHIKHKNFFKKDLICFAIYFISLCFLSIFFISVNYSFLSNDSWNLLIGGKYIATYHDLTEGLIAKGGIFSFIINASGSLYGFDYPYALYPLMALSFFLFYFYNLYSPFNGEKLALNRKFSFNLLTILFLLSGYFILFNAYYLHSNLIYGIYSFIALYGLWKRSADGDKNWLIISAVALFTSSFLRMEGPLFSLIIIIILISARKIKFKEKLYYVGAFSLFIAVWHIKLSFILKEQSSKYFLDTNRALLITIFYFLTFAVLLFSQRGVLNRLKEYFPLMMLYILSIGWTILIVTKGLKIRQDLLILKRYGIFILNAVKYGGWGITWIALGLLFIIGLSLKRVKDESVFLYYIFSFLLLFNIIHLFRGGWRLSWGDSGNRMLMHVIFVIAFYAFLKFRSVLFPKNQIE